MRAAPFLRAMTFAAAALSAIAAHAAPQELLAETQARELMKAGRWEEAARRWEDVLSPGVSKRELKEGLPALGRCHEASRNYQKALTAYQRALELDEKNADRLLDLARVYALTDLNAEAVALYKRVLVLDKSRHDARLALAQVDLKMGLWDDARAEAEAYAQWEPRDLAAQRLLADIDDAQGDPASAGRRREQIVAKDPSPQAYYELGRLWVRAGQWDMADAAFSRAEDMGLRTAAVYLHRGVVRWLKGDLLGARVLWQKALERQPGQAAAQFFLSLAARERGDARPALDLARKARAAAQGDVIKSLTTLLTETTKR